VLRTPRPEQFRFGKTRPESAKILKMGYPVAEVRDRGTCLIGRTQMRNWKQPAAFGAAALGLTVALLSSTVSVHALRDEQPNRIAIEYMPTQKPEFQDVYTMLKEQKVLEKLQDIYSPFLLPEVLTFRTKDCGMVNAWYAREDSKPVVTLCYDLFNHIIQTLPKEPSPEGVTALDAKIGQFFWFASHEAGHAMFDIFDAPIWGHEEDAADGFAGD
jgi:hypothetical protein